MKSFILISALCVYWALAAKPEKRHVSQEGRKQETRVLYDFGTYKSDNSGKLDFAGLKIGSGQGYAENVNKKIVEKKIPAPYTLEKLVPYTVEKKVPCEVKVPVPQPQSIEKQVPYPVKEIFPYYVPQPVVRVPVEKRVPYEVDKTYPEEVPYNVNVLVPSPYTIEKKVERPVAVPVKVPVNKPYPIYKEVPIALQQEVPYTVKAPAHIQLSSGGNQWQQNNQVNKYGDRFQQEQLNSRDKINHETQHKSKEITQTYRPDSDVGRNHQRLDLAQLQHQLTSDYENEKQISQHQHFNGISQGQQQVKQGQWQQLAGYNKDVHNFYPNANFDFAQNNFELPEQNIATQNYKKVNSDKAIGKEQNGNGISGKLKNSYGEQNGHENTYQSQNNGLTQLQQQNGRELTSQINHETISNQRPHEYNNDHQNQWQKQRGNALEHTYDAPDKSTSFQVEFGNDEHQQISYGEPAQQQLIYLGSKTNEKPQQQQYASYETYASHVESGNNQHQSYGEVALINSGLKTNEKPQQQQYTSYETHVNHESSKPKQPQIDYVNYEKSFAPRVQHQSTYLNEADGRQQVKYGSEQSSYTAHAQAVGNAGSYEDNQHSYKAVKQQHPTHEYMHHTGSYGYEINGEEQPKRQEQPAYTSGYSNDKAAGNGLRYSHEIVGQEQQSNYAYGSSKDVGKVVSYTHEIIGQGKHSYKSQGVQNPNGGSSSHEPIDQGQQSFKSYPAYTTGFASNAAEEQGVLYSFKSTGQKQQYYKAEEKQESTIGSSSHQALGHSGPSSHKSIDQGQNYELPSFVTQGNKNQQISFAKYESIIGLSGDTSADQGHQNFQGSSLIHKVRQQPNYLTNGGFSDRARQVTGYENSGKQGKGKVEGQQNKGWK